MSKKVLFILTSRDQYEDGTPTGLWLEEASEPYNILTEADIDVDITSIEGGAVPLDPNSTQNNELDKYAEFVAKIKDVPSIAEVDVAQYDAVYLPGGHGTVFDYAHNQQLSSILADFKDEDKIISSVCHGPSAFVGAKDKQGNFLVNGVTLTSFTDEEERAMGLENKVPFLTQTELENQGAKFITKENFSEHVEIDSQFITGQNPQSSVAIGKALRDALK
ncbi:MULTISPECIES: type 1 glutamine amidotransferase domain-containing protein [Staphylococcus]|uniref:Type 1 glutamine amidotransferase domain-containing protein n=1 Tax=Staphylococcus xylosus TaxID=1288 RepID=A0A418IKC4_STAXY|nr:MULTISPECIES: type 1 glutamine amidotransferase domain-containing protein [Staphylococcus]MBF0813488.1 type 1 glutamine amidotransferase domain-containing protein [Staphylococcus saprophyticus]MDW8542120.1 type 1 glutamine amidotransferase domain-containing protein [Staphylococcus sp. KG4-1]MRF37858.1 type 1 glutamine amidotransferase domain-containing protein [Staphylococcus sp. KY49P]MDW8560570.1 type 1 glutamine amidotransferase domain-containing protein [Staphylococcus sp. KG4-3]NQD9892